MEKLPKVSIIIPTYNRANYLSQAIESALSQDYPNLEIIVSDNYSTDETPKLVQKYIKDKRFKYFRNKENIGMVRNWRKAVFEYATGDWFLILSDDDYFIKDDYISKAVELINENKHIVMVYANGYIADGRKYLKLELPFNSVEDGKTIFFSRGKVKPQDFILCNVMFRRNLAIELNAFSNEKNLSCDSELFLKLCLLGKIGVIKDFVSVYRKHSSNNIYLVNENIDFLVGNLDYVLEPYVFAKEKELLSKEELNIWLKEVLSKMVMDIVILVKVTDKKRVYKIDEVIYKKIGVSLKEIFWASDLYTKMMYILSRNRKMYFFLKRVEYLVDSVLRKSYEL